jgi:hypothetical protein
LSKKQKRAMKKKSAIRKRRKQRKLNKKYESLKEKEKSLDFLVQMMDVFKGMGLDPEALSSLGEGEMPPESLGEGEEEDLSPEEMEQFTNLLSALMGGDLPEGLFDNLDPESLFAGESPTEEAVAETEEAEPQVAEEPSTDEEPNSED